jgi:hypothetical protein
VDVSARQLTYGGARALMDLCFIGYFVITTLRILSDLNTTRRDQHHILLRKASEVGSCAISHSFLENMLGCVCICVPLLIHTHTYTHTYTHRLESVMLSINLIKQ